MLYPTRNKASELLNDYKFILMFYEILLDTYSPIHIDNALEKNDQNCFVLKNVDRSHQRGRYSLIGINPKASIKKRHHHPHTEKQHQRSPFGESNYIFVRHYGEAPTSESSK